MWPAADSQRQRCCVAATAAAVAGEGGAQRKCSRVAEGDFGYYQAKQRVPSQTEEDSGARIEQSPLAVEQQPFEESKQELEINQWRGWLD
jgi:hypothetical protein